MRKYNATIIKLLLSSCLSLCSCLSHNDKFKRNDDWIKDFNLISSSTPNPDKIVFRVHADDKLRALLLLENWDSIKFSGGFFDTLNFNKKVVGIAETDNPEEVILGLSTGKFFMYTQNQMDSIASKTFDKIEVTIYYKADMWKLKPHVKNEGNL